MTVPEIGRPRQCAQKYGAQKHHWMAPAQAGKVDRKVPSNTVDPMKLRPRIRGYRLPAPRGQSLVEFALVLPLLLILLLGVADFGRVFTSSIASEAAVRNAAEAAALQYIQFDLQDSALNGSLTQAQYDLLRGVALDVGCHEAERLPGRTLAGSVCTMPWFAACIHVHDSAVYSASLVDANCGQNHASAPPECTHMADAWNSTRLGPSNGRPYVEVRLCYRFDPLMTVPLGDWGSVWLQKENNFVVTDYP